MKKKKQKKKKKQTKTNEKKKKKKKKKKNNNKKKNKQKKKKKNKTKKQTNKQTNCFYLYTEVKCLRWLPNVKLDLLSVSGLSSRNFLNLFLRLVTQLKEEIHLGNPFHYLYGTFNKGE